MAYYNEQLQELQKQVVRQSRIESLLEELYIQQKDLTEKVKEFEKQKNREQSDVDKLEGRSLSSFFYNVVGKRDEKLDQERREAYAAAVKYDAAAKEYAYVEDEINSKEAELRELHGCSDRYAKLLNEKKESIKASGSQNACEVIQIEEKISYIEKQRVEINEAISAGRKAIGMTDAVLSSLDSAEGWGTWDLLGGGLISDLAKHSNLDDAQEQVERLQVQLRRFKTELTDVTISANLQVSIDGFLRFADYFFDGLFADWSVLDRINESQEQVRKTKEQIKSVLNKLDGMNRNADSEISVLKSKLDDMVLKAEI